MGLFKNIKLFKNKRNIYILILCIITLLGFIIVPTYAKFYEGYVTDKDIVSMNLSFDVSITGIEEYHEVQVEAGQSVKFNIQVTNDSSSIAYYGMWYKMISPTYFPENGSIQIGKISEDSGETAGSIAAGGSTTASVGIFNATSSTVKVYIGINSSTTSTNDIEYLDGKYLITGVIETFNDINIKDINVDGVYTASLPTDGFYDLDSYECIRGSVLRWDNFTKTITYEEGSKVGDVCSLNFVSSDDYPLLNSMPIGSYVKYEGVGGTVGSTSVQCKKNGSGSSSTPTDETEAPNSCLGQNARQDLDASGYTYGYCFDANNKFYTTGWRLAYIGENNKPVIISGGSPECNASALSTGNSVYINTANTKALKYCNTNYVDGNCSCLDSDSDGLCDSASTDAWGVNDTDFYYMTKAIAGIGKRLAANSSTLGDSGGVLGDTLYCFTAKSTKECGYNNDLIDNGGHYFFAAYYGSDNYGIRWYPVVRYIGAGGYDSSYVLGLRPVINLSASVYVTGGTGTIDDPYVISK